MLARLPGTYRAQDDTRLLARAVARSGLARGRRVLDVATGGGAVAIAAAKAGAGSVTAVDLSTRSVLTARLNSLLNGVRVDVRRGDLFAPVAGQRFDLVLANPPYVPAPDGVLPRHRIGRCWDAGTDGRAVLDRICAEAPRVLADGGVLMVTHSAVSGADLTVARMRDAGMDATVVARATVPFGPVMRSRAALLAAQGLIEPGQQHEELVVVQARLPAAARAGSTAAAGPATGGPPSDESRLRAA